MLDIEKDGNEAKYLKVEKECDFLGKHCVCV